MSKFKANNNIQGLSKELNAGDTIDLKDEDASDLVRMGALELVNPKLAKVPSATELVAAQAEEALRVAEEALKKANQ